MILDFLHFEFPLWWILLFFAPKIPRFPSYPNTGLFAYSFLFLHEEKRCTAEQKKRASSYNCTGTNI